MKLAFCLYKYFPFGGLQRDFMAIAQECHRRGHSITAFVLDWQGDIPAWLNVVVVPAKGWSSHKRYQRYSSWLHQQRVRDEFDKIIGFNKMPGLDVYFAADPCFMEKLSQQQLWYQKTARNQHFLAYEQAVFEPQSTTQILLIAPHQQNSFQHFYGTADERMHLLPPGIDTSYQSAADRQQLRTEFRQEFKLADDEQLLLLVGSGFKTKGLDRALRAIAALPDKQRHRVRYFVIGQDNPRRFLRQAKSLGIADRVNIFPGRSDVRRFMYGADLMLHPAYFESAGKVLMEAVASGLPVLVTDSCGNAPYIKDANAGCVLASPFQQQRLNQLLSDMLWQLPEQDWGSNGIAYAASHDLFSQPQRAVDVIEGDL